ncbi:hypothetical protein [Calothrix rhizosoleniae]|nr:hypothetical protein [Calothrix rhizosoleniae]
MQFVRCAITEKLKHDRNNLEEEALATKTLKKAIAFVVIMERAIALYPI